VRGREWWGKVRVMGGASRTGDGGRCDPHGQWWEVRAARAMLGAMGAVGAGGRENNRKVVTSICF